jgi:cysteine desulfurase
LKKQIYLDYNATTPVDQRVLDAMLPYFNIHFGNAASKTHAHGWLAADAVEQARQQVADLINAEKDEIVFTSGTTEAINIALKGVWENHKSKRNHIVTVKTEHKAVLDVCDYLSTQGATVSYLSVNREGIIDLHELQNIITDKTILVCVMIANNETGVIQPISEIAKLAHEKGAFFFTDATQATGKITIDVTDGIDLMCLSGHKFYGPKGVGALYVRRKNPRVNLATIVHGGGHEKNLRAGTLNVPAIVGMGKAAEFAKTELWETGAQISKQRTKLEQYLLDAGNVYINGSTKNRLPNTTNLLITNVKADKLTAAVPLVSMAMGSACTSAAAEPSHVLKAMGLTDEEVFSSVRISVGKYTTDEEIDFAIEKITAAIKLLRG